MPPRSIVSYGPPGQHDPSDVQDISRPPNPKVKKDRYGQNAEPTGVLRSQPDPKWS